ncbi:MAG: asparagine synthase-related protein [Motiliproteus sp.]
MPLNAVSPSCIAAVRVLSSGLVDDQIYRQPDLEVTCFGHPRSDDNQLLSATQIAQRSSDPNQPLTVSGHFAVVLYWPKLGICRIYADRFASTRLYFYAVTGAPLLVSDSLHLVKQRLDEQQLPVTLSQQSLVNYLFFHMIPSPETIYREVFCLQPAEQIDWDGKQLKRRQWWQPRFDQTSLRNETELADELITLMRQVVPDYCQQEATGCFLSGGLDSSSLAGLVAETLSKPDVFSIGFPIEQYNELDYARTAVDHFDLTGHEYLMSPEDVVTALPTVIASMDQPFGNSSAMPAYFCAKLAKSQGINRLIAGDGGDELFAGNERYSKQLQLDRLRQRLRPLIGIMDHALLRSPLPDSPALLRKAKSMTRQLKMSVPQNLEYFNFLNLIERESIFSDSLLSVTDQSEPERRCQELFDHPTKAGVLDRMLFMDWKHTLADNDLVKVNTMCRLAGVDVAYPLLDDRLLDFSLRVPADIKLTPGKLRHLYKMAMTGFLPEKIIHKPKHGFGLPFGLWTAEHAGLRNLAYDAIASLDQYDLFRPGFIDDVKRRHQHEHAKHYGELVWILMVLAMWLDTNR